MSMYAIDEGGAIGMIQHAKHTTDKDGYNTLEVECAFGTLVAGFFGDPEAGYSGIYIDLVRPDGKGTQCAMVETVPYSCYSDGEGDPELHVLAWDGDEEEPVVKQVIDPDGEYVY